MKTVYILIILSTIPFINQAQNTQDSLNIFSLSLEELLNVEVNIGSNVVDNYKNQPVSITTIDHQQLELSGARTLLDAIMLFVPGVFAVEDQDDVIIGFRGLAADNNSKVLFLIDGVNMNTEFFWGPPSAILNSNNYDFIQRIEVIRGPGSVTLGQGALLGVTNIVTKNSESYGDKNIKAEGNAFVGRDNFVGGNGFVSFKNEKLKGHLMFGLSGYDGQAIRNEGWAKDKLNEGYQGGNISNIGTRLKKSTNTNLISGFSYKDLNIGVMLFDQERDLYNFYRDRNTIRQTLIGTNLGYKKSISEKATVKADLNFTIDDFGLKSVNGQQMGGTRENRFGFKTILNLQNIKNNNLAIGTEYRNFDMGNKNFDGYNFINNEVTSRNSTPDYIDYSNSSKQWVFHNQVSVLSFFAEDFYQLSNDITLFAALRYDNHSYWGSNISPRIGTIYNLSESMSFKLSYQEGFRGAVGAQFSGGFSGDGFLSSNNFNQIINANIPLFDSNGNSVGSESNLPQTKPEKIGSTELSFNWKTSEKVHFNVVGFYNKVTDVIDVGVIYRDPSVYQLPGIGSDNPGDWNGYWFFKNTDGSINEIGFEGNILYKSDRVLGNLSHSFVKSTNSDDQQKGSMYLNEENNFKAYPQNVTRLNMIYSLTKKLSSGLNYLYYYSWYSPTNQKVDGNHIVNLSLKYNVHKNGFISIHSLNLLNSQELYPMTNNVGDAALSDGAPSMEQTSFWIKIGWKI